MKDDNQHAKYLELSRKAAESVAENLEIYRKAQEFVERVEVYRNRASRGLMDAQDLYDDIQKTLKSFETNN